MIRLRRKQKTMIIINNKGYYTENEKLDGRLFLGQLQENYISLWDKWYQEIPESQTYDYTDMNAWYKTHPKNYNDSWEEWYQQRPALPNDLATDILEGWSNWEKQHPKFPDTSIIDKFGHVKKIYVDYPAYVQTIYRPQSRQEDDGLKHGLYYDLATGKNSRDFKGTSEEALPTDNIKFTYINTNGSTDPRQHRSLVYPDENYFDIRQNTIMPWLNWLYSNAEILARLFLAVKDIQTIYGPYHYRYIKDTYVIGLRSLIDDLKKYENLDQYKYGILSLDKPQNGSYMAAPFPVLFLYAGDYIKRNKDLEPKWDTEYWIDYALCENDILEQHAARPYPHWFNTSIRTMGLTIGFLNTITESEFINKRLAIIAVAPLSWPSFAFSDSDPDIAFLYYEAQNKSFGIQKLNSTVHEIVNGSRWNNYSVLNLPFYTVALKDDNEHLYNQYSFGENLKYKKRFIPSPVFTFPRPTGYCSHAIRYNEGIITGMPDIRIKEVE